jgi:hypothetical protein
MEALEGIGGVAWRWESRPVASSDLAAWRAPLHWRWAEAGTRPLALRICKSKDLSQIGFGELEPAGTWVAFLPPGNFDARTNPQVWNPATPRLAGRRAEFTALTLWMWIK